MHFRRMFIALLLASAACATDPGDGLPVSTFTYDRSQALDIQIAPFTGSALTLVSQISFVSPGGGRVTGFLAQPRNGSGPWAGLVMLHDLPGGNVGAYQAMTYDGGVEMAARNAVVICIDAPWQRRAVTPDFSLQDSVDQVQLVQDLQRAVDYLLTRPDVDPSRLAFMGAGYGGAMGALLSGVETRLKAFALVTPDGGLVARHTDANGEPIGPLAAIDATARTQWLAAMTPIEPIRFIRLLPPAALLIQSARQDQQVAVDDAEALHAAAPRPRTITWYNSDHALPPEAKVERFSWLAQRIGTLTVPAN